MLLNKIISVTLILLIALFENPLSQVSQEGATSGKIEVSLITDYRVADSLYTFNVIAMGVTRWNSTYYLTNDFYDATLVYIPEQSDTEKFALYGWNFDGTSKPRPGDPTVKYNNLCYGLYKFVCKIVRDHNTGIIITEIDSFYLDICDDHYPDQGIYGNNDFYIKYDENLEENRFSYKSYTGSTFSTIINGQTIGVWTILGVTTPPSYLKFQPTTPTNLRCENYGGHPRLVWNLSEPQEAATYEVWRKVCSSPPKFNQIVEDWRCIQNLPAGTNNWTDNEFQVSGTVNQASYKVRAVSGDSNLYSPSFSNTVTITGEFLPFDKQPAPAVCLKPGNPSISIFPNPFNSTIRIALDSPAEPITEMVIYDLQGRAVRCFTSFSNPYQITATWDGSNAQNQPLTSGIYFILVQTTQHRLFREKIVFIK